MSVSPKSRFVGPTAAVVHSSASISSIATNVGSPPIVSRTSRSRKASSTRSPSRSIADHCASVYGLVTRGGSYTRVTDISKPNVTSHGSIVPEIGEAETGFAAQASGRWPSPANRPDVGSSPTHPAPGR